MKQTLPEQRFERLEKKRRTNRVLNLFIAIVVILILIFGYKLISDQMQKNAAEQPIQSEQNEQKPENEAGTSGEDNESDTEGNNAVEESGEAVNERVIVPTDEDGVIEAFTNPSWEPIGTTQSEPHVAQFIRDSQDWKEMVQAVTYAAELDESDIILWHLGNGGAQNKAVATISTKDNKYRYRVYIEWVENEGWKPTLVKQLET